MATSLLFSLILLSLSISSSSALLFSETIVDAADVLSDSGYLSMALNLQTVFQTLLLQSPTATVFAPSDSAFVRSGQPPLFLLQYHTLPQRLSLEDLKALPYGTSIPTMLLNRSLIVTTSDVDALLSINNVTVNELTVYDAGSVVIYGVDEFFDPSFRIYSNSVPEQCPGRNDFFEQETSSFEDVDCFGEASDLLRSRGYSKMAAFMDMQLTGFGDGTSVTIFAPVDESIEEHAKNFSDYSVMFRQHVVPGWLPWKVMSGLETGALLPTFSEDFRIKITRFGDILALNGVPILFMDMFCCNWLVVHGLDQLVTSSIKQDLKEGSFFAFNDNVEENAKEGSFFAFNDNVEENAPDYGENSIP
ncbi:putative fasciclin-like arabinogalactan protein 20 [Vitis vinifera]|uniref:Putative fasciclin-like arabinogalactan protein 20 n=1 Tax=Vitis vinifera TaxID=29760 RepID=A0A438JDC0_VITVI|nr:putative fasciclin-like arabinogalactan protein 20 [Vitis vinifera]